MSIFIYGTIIALVVVLVAVQLLADLRFAWTKATRIADCRDGALVKVVGRAVAIGELAAPLSGRPCVAYRITATRKQTRQKKGAARAHFDKFIVKDETGEAMVDPGGLTAFGHVHLRIDTDFESRRRWEGLEVQNLPGLALLDLPKADHADEAIVEIGELVAVRGRVAIDAAGVVRLVPDKGKTMVVTDQPRLIGRR
jgi:hypothetical protein